MFGSDKRYLSFTLSETVIKLAQVKSSGVVEKIARISAVDNSADALGQALKTLSNGFDRKAPVVCVIPVSAATSKTIEVPSTDPQEIKSIINLQVSRHTPYSREEVLVGYVNLGLGESNHTKVLLVIVHRNVVKDRIKIIEKAGLNTDKILFASEGVGRLYFKGLNLKKDANPVGVIDLTLGSVNFMVIARGSTIFCRSIPIGIKSLLEEGPDAVTVLLDEFNKSIEAYIGEDIDLPPASYVVTTDHDVAKNILPALKEGLKAEVLISPYMNFVKAGSVKAKLQKDFADDSFLDVIAPVATISKCEVNLMPEEMIAKKTVERQSKEAIKTVIAALLILLLLGGAIMSKIYFKDAYLNQNLRAQYAAQKEEVKRLQERLNKVKIVKQYLQGRMISLDIIHELYKRTPNQIYLNTIVFDEDGSLTISGVSDTMSRVFTYVKTLSDSSLFKNVKTKSTATKKDNGKDVAVFELNIQVQETPKE